PADEESDTGHRLPSCEEVLDPAPEAHLDLRVALELALLERAVDPADEELDVSLLERLQSSHGLAALALLEDDFAHAERQVLGFDARRREDRGPRLRKVRSKILAIGAVLVLHDVPLGRDEQDIEIAQADAGVAEEVTNQSVEQHVLFERAAAEPVARRVGNEQEALVDSGLPQIALEVIVELGLLLVGRRNDRPNVFAGDLDEAEIQARPAALTETNVEFSQHAFLRSFRQVSRCDVVDPRVEIGLARRLPVTAGAVEVHALVDVQPVNEEILESRLAARDAADREQE